MVAEITETETEWDEQQQAIMLALAAWRDTRCHRCGGDLRETTDPKAEGTYRPLLPIRCHRCTALAASEAKYRDSPHPHALMHRVVRAPQHP